MRTLRFLPAAAVVALLLSCRTAPVAPYFDPGIVTADDGSTPDSVRIRYLRDAAAIVLREQVDRGAATLDLPADRIEDIYNALIHVYTLRQSAARDTVVRYIPIHAALTPDPFHILVEFDSSAVWTHNWQRNILHTGQEDLDLLLEATIVSIPVYYFWGARHAAILKTGTPLNTPVLAQIFAAIDGIETARPVYQESDTDIQAMPRALCWELFFIQTGKRRWVFRVYQDGSAFFLKSKQDA